MTEQVISITLEQYKADIREAKASAWALGYIAGACAKSAMTPNGDADRDAV